MARGHHRGRIGGGCGQTASGRVHLLVIYFIRKYSRLFCSSNAWSYYLILRGCSILLLHVSVWCRVCVGYVCVSLGVCTCICMHVDVHVKPEVGVEFLLQFPPCFLKCNLSLNLEVIHPAGLDGQWVPGSALSMPGLTCTRPAFARRLRIWGRVLMFACHLFIFF